MRTPLDSKLPRIFFFFFFLSGAASLIDQIVWLRLAFASFGVITPVVSVVLSVFMLGLAIGSWFAGVITQKYLLNNPRGALLWYGCLEAIIAAGAVVVPVLFKIQKEWLLTLGQSDTGSYLFWSATQIALAILPWCVAMGATFPFMMSYLYTTYEDSNLAVKQSFSYLYLANVIGAMTGAALTAIALIELLGFQKTLWFAAFCNLIIFFCVLKILYFTPQKNATIPTKKAPSTHDSVIPQNQLPFLKRFEIGAILFITGFVSMSMEVIWTRAFSIVLMTTVYAFAFVLVVYLFSTWVGSMLYRKHLKEKKDLDLPTLALGLFSTALLPLLFNDPRLNPNQWNIILSLFPFCSILGYLTPKLVDQISGGNPKSAGNAYALNVLGCIFGPLVSGYILLPRFGIKVSILLLTLPFLILCLLYLKKIFSKVGIFQLAVHGAVILVSFFWATTYEDKIPSSTWQLKRDHTATVIATGEGMSRQLLVNGIGITVLTPITKLMAHLPLLLLSHPPESALVICFGMGTTFRSLASWGIDATAVELVPSVKEFFGFFFSDAAEVIRKPNAHIIVDDGRRFLRRTNQSFDVITLDPPPPVEAAGSSLLYSKEFYQDVKLRLNPGGILQQWHPGGELAIVEAAAAAIFPSFKFVRAFNGMGFGVHFYASDEPIDLSRLSTNLAASLAKMPPAAIADLMEWFPGRTPQEVIKLSMSGEIDLLKFLPTNPSVVITDDIPFNEYYLLRRTLAHWAKIYQKMRM
jgi:spermidine synthase